MELEQKTLPFANTANVILVPLPLYHEQELERVYVLTRLWLTKAVILLH